MRQAPDRRCVNGIRTNGTLIDQDAVKVLAAEGVYAGLSLDGLIFGDACLGAIREFRGRH